MTSLDPKFTIREEFPAVNYEQWRELAEIALKGASFDKKLVTHTYEGLDLQPIYTRMEGGSDKAGSPGRPPYVRGSTPLGAVERGWDLRQECKIPQLEVANEAIISDLEGGVTSLSVVLDQAAQWGFDPDDHQTTDLVGRDGVMAYHVDDLDELFSGVDLSRVSISLDAGPAFLPAAAMLSALWKRRNTPTADASGAFNSDPLAVVARYGKLPISLNSAFTQMADLAKWTSETFPQVTSVRVDTSPYHHAGATAAQDLAFGMATAVQYLRSMTDSGMSIDAAATQILFGISLGTHHFLAIAKLRAGRRLWARVVESCGGSPDCAAQKVHARISDRVLTRLDPNVNLLRNTVAIFAAGLGGADAITSVPFDYLTGASDEINRRIARNTGLVLQEESHLNRVVDPAGGSWFLENLTSQIAEQAWSIFQEVERRGGMVEALKSGFIAEQIELAFEPRAKDIATRKQGITGVSEFPDLEQGQVVHSMPTRTELRAAATQRVRRQQQTAQTIPSYANLNIASAVQAATEGATIGKLSAALGFHKESITFSPIPARRFAEGYEALRDASDKWNAAHGKRPSVFLVNLGPIAHFTARATYSKSFFEAGGFDVFSNDGFDISDDAAVAFQQSGAAIAVLCSSDKLYPKFVSDVAPKLKAAGARTVILAGKPGDNAEVWRRAGVDRFIYISCDVLATLSELLAEEGVTTS